MRPGRGNLAATVGGCLAAALLLAPALGATCTPPVAPDPTGRPVRPTPPTKGLCVGAKLGTPGCLGWESDRYNEDVKAFNERAKTFGSAAAAYVAQLNAYVKASADYAQCEVKALN